MSELTMLTACDGTCTDVEFHWNPDFSSEWEAHCEELGCLEDIWLDGGLS